MFSRRNLALFLAGVTIFAATTVCGYGGAAPAPTGPDFNEPSGGGAAPQPTQAALPTFAPGIPVTGGGETPAAPADEAPLPAIPESRRLTLEFPPKIRSGDSDVVRLTLEVDTLGNVTPTAQTQGNVITGQTVLVPNLYETHNVIAEARLDLAGAEVRPAEEISEPLLPGESVTFFWSVRPSDAGIYRGTVWLFLRFVDKATKEETRKPLSAQTVQIVATDLFGLNGNLARIAGGAGSVVGGVLGFPFVDEVLKWLWKRLLRRG